MSFYSITHSRKVSTVSLKSAESCLQFQPIPPKWTQLLQNYSAQTAWSSAFSRRTALLWPKSMEALVKNCSNEIIRTSEHRPSVTLPTVDKFHKCVHVYTISEFAVNLLSRGVSKFDRRQWKNSSRRLSLASTGIESGLVMTDRTKIELVALGRPTGRDARLAACQRT